MSRNPSASGSTPPSVPSTRPNPNTSPTSIPRQPLSTSPLRPSTLLGRPASSLSSIPPPGIFAPSSAAGGASPPTPSRSPQGGQRPPYGGSTGPGGYSYPGFGVLGAGSISRPTSSGYGTNNVAGRARLPSLTTTRPAQGNDMREWSYFGVDIPINNVASLSADSLDPTSPTSASGDLGRRTPSALGQTEVFSTTFGGERWKLEILCPPRTPESATHKLSLYLSCHILDTSFSPDIIPTTLMLGIREPKEQIGKREARGGWVWQIWEQDWCFRAGREYWECHTFPNFSEILTNKRILELDTFILSVQIQSPCQATLPQIQDAHFVPSDLLGGVSSLLDDKSTGDVLIYVHERQPGPTQSSESDITATSTSESATPTSLYRKRALYAHSAIMKARSSYFADMLQEGWAETTSGDERKRSIVKIEDFDFVTVFWLLNWLYTNEISFLPFEDVRLLPADDLPSGWLSRPSSLSWDWLTPASITSLMSSLTLSDNGLSDIAEAESSPSPSPTPAPTPPPLSTKAAGKRRSSGGSNGNNKGGNVKKNEPSSPTRVSHAAGRISPLGGGRISPTTVRSGGNRKGFTSNANVTGGGEIEFEPHTHPVRVQAPASALAIYRIAHRYSLSSLASLALAHIIQTLTPRTAFPLLLSTRLWPDLHNAIKGYALAHFDEMSREAEFGRCYAEVGEGMWEHGGEVLHDFTLALTPAWTA